MTSGEAIREGPYGAGAGRHINALVLTAFGGFGLTWGMYAAAVPVIRANTGVSDGFLGVALSGIGVTALPAMFVAGRLIDRVGRVAFLAALGLFAVTAPLPVVVHTGSGLVVTLLVFGGCSGAFDVAINHTAVTGESVTGRRVLNRAHAVFSFGLLAGSLTFGAWRAAGPAPGWLMAGFGGALLVVGVFAWPILNVPGPAAGSPSAPGSSVWRKPLIWAAGVLGMLALLVESGLQQWSAVFLQDVLKTAPATSSLGPAAFAAAAAAGRLAGHVLARSLSDVALLVGAGLIAGPGSLLLATAGRLPVGLAGLMLAGMGISVAAPTLYGFAGSRVPASVRGRTVAVVSGVAYVGLLGGPGLVGVLADAITLRGAIGALAVIALLLAAGSLTLRRWTRRIAGEGGT